jgi:hypothetical protein
MSSSHARDWARYLRLNSQVVIERGENLVGKTTEVLNRSMQHIGICGNQGEKPQMRERIVSKEKDVSPYKPLNVLD